VSSENDKPLNEKDAAAFLGVEPETLHEWARRGLIGHFRPTPGVYVYAHHHLWAYLQACEHRPKETDGRKMKRAS
jgi:predicted site-specific integrase-resolvase